jgi:hypothetical protein
VPRPRELDSIGRDNIILYVGAGVRFQDTPFIHLMVDFQATRLPHKKKIIICLIFYQRGMKTTMRLRT